VAQRQRNGLFSKLMLLAMLNGKRIDGVGPLLLKHCQGNFRMNRSVPMRVIRQGYLPMFIPFKLVE